jgi:hypothetical protein
MVLECRHGRCLFVDFVIVLYMFIYNTIAKFTNGERPWRHSHTIYNTITKSTNGERPWRHSYTIYNTITKSTDGERPWRHSHTIYTWSFSVCRLYYCIIYGVGMSSWSFSVCRLYYCIIYGVGMSSWSFSVSPSRRRREHFRGISCEKSLFYAKKS